MNGEARLLRLLLLSFFQQSLASIDNKFAVTEQQQEDTTRDYYIILMAA